MGLHKQNLSFVILLLLGLLAVSYACDCSDPPKPSPHPVKPPKHPVKPPTVKPPTHTPKPPTVKPPTHTPKPPTHTPKPPTVKPPTHTPKPPTVKPPPPHIPSPPPYTPKPPTVKPPPPPAPTPPVVTPPPPTPRPTPETPCPPPPPPPPTETPCPPPPPPQVPSPKPQTCPINALRLGACVDVLGGLIHIGLGSSGAKEKCCPLLGGLVGLDAAVCLCTTIRAKLLNIDLIIPIAIELLVDCGKTPPRDFKCPAPLTRTPVSA